MVRVRWLGEETCHATEEVGGKAANLSRLAFLHQGPLGFALPAFPSAPGDAMPEEAAAAVHDGDRQPAGRGGGGGWVSGSQAMGLAGGRAGAAASGGGALRR